MIPIRENYVGYEPPPKVQSTVSSLLSAVPEQYLAGLECVVLTNSIVIGKGKTRVGDRKYLRKDCRGFYHPKSRHQAPWIEIIVDNVLRGYADHAVLRFLWRFRFAREAAFFDTLFHEIGHHLEHTRGAVGRGPEQTAEAWNKKLTTLYMKKRYSYFKYLKPLRPLLRFIHDRIPSGTTPNPR